MPRRGDRRGALGSKAVDLAEAVGCLLDHPQGVQAEMVDDALGGLGADPFDQAGAEVAADALDAGGQGAGPLANLELAAVLRVAGPAATQPQALTRLGATQGADHGDQVRRATDHHPVALLAALLVDEGDP